MDLWVLIAVLVLLSYYIHGSNQLRKWAGSELEDLLPKFAADIKTRALRGQDPDWLRYSEESDRQHEYDCESLRNFATTALATGIGGTMVVLTLNLWGASGSGDAISSLLGEMAFALLASLSGVATNLVILIGLLPRANTQFDTAREGFVNELRVVADAHAPRTPDARLNDTVSERLDEFLEDSAGNFRGIVQGFRESIASLDGVATTFDTSSGKMEAATAVLSSSIAELNGLPGNLGEELSKARQTWTNDIREQQDRYLQGFREIVVAQNEAVGNTLATLEESQAQRAEAEAQWREQRAKEESRHRTALFETLSATAAEQQGVVQKTLSAFDEWQTKKIDADKRWEERDKQERERQERAILQLVNATTDVANATSRLPTEFREEIGRASTTLGHAFGSEARQQVADVINATARGNEEFRKHLDGHMKQLLNEMGDIVQEGLKPTEEGISRIGRNLEVAGNALRGSIQEFADHGARFRESLHGAAQQIEESSVQLAGVHQKTRDSADRIQENHQLVYDTLNQTVNEIRSLLEGLSKGTGRVGFRGLVRSLFRRAKTQRGSR